MFKFINKAFVAIFLVTPVTTWAQNMPIEMKASSERTPPIMAGNYKVIGYWDVDDFSGNNGGKLGPYYSSMGTHPISNPSRGTYMATLGANMSDLNRITDLSTTVSNNSVEGMVLPLIQGNSNADLIYTDNARTEYIVGIWDVDGGGGRGNDGSFGTYAMKLTARLGTRVSDRKLMDLQLVASNNKNPTLKKGYEVIGYWDVDKGGSRGTDGSKGHYMMTLLAKWDR